MGDGGTCAAADTAGIAKDRESWCTAVAVAVAAADGAGAGAGAGPGARFTGMLNAALSCASAASSTSDSPIGVASALPAALVLAPGLGSGPPASRSCFFISSNMAAAAAMSSSEPPPPSSAASQTSQSALPSRRPRPLSPSRAALSLLSERFRDCFSFSFCFFFCRACTISSHQRCASSESYTASPAALNGGCASVTEMEANMLISPGSGDGLNSPNTSSAEYRMTFRRSHERCRSG
mmetsp:Transcript_14373/g.45890  ORF Transcript_14373/g.45890 Transcript_14373/m.45890 type:complete len:237 (-) Transcript_14373:328-1038(-)